MVFEIEKRVLFKTSNQFFACEQKIASFASKTQEYFYKSFLFTKPEFLRIRVVQNKDVFESTKKLGTYQDVARKEINKEYPLSQLAKFVEDLKKRGFSECVVVTTYSSNYSLDGLTFSFNKMNYLGYILEIEALTEDNKEIEFLEQKIVAIMEKFGLEELDTKKYQKMMDSMYEKNMLSLDTVSFSID